MTTFPHLQVSCGVTYGLHLAPRHGLNWCSQDNEWRVLNEHAEFQARHGLPLAGWYMIELTVERSVTTVASSVFFDAENDSVRVDMALRVGKITKRLVYVPAGIRRLRFRPMNAPGNFKLRHFRIAWVTPWFARDRLIRRLINMHSDFRDLTQREAMQHLRQIAHNNGESWRSVALREYDSTFISLCSKQQYHVWIEHWEKRPHAQQMSFEIKSLGNCTPLVWMPATARTSLEDIQVTLESLRDQVIKTWRLVIVVGVEERNILVRKLGELLVVEPRLAIAVSLKPAKDCWVLGMLPGDLLAASAFYELAKEVQCHPETRLVLADEDHLDAEGRRSNPCFKPGWNPDLLLSQPYLGRAVFMRGDLWGRLALAHGPLHRLAPETLIHKMALALLDESDAQGSGHWGQVAKILYHVAAGPVQLVAPQGDVELLSLLDRQGIAAKVSCGEIPGSSRIHWPIPEPAPLVSLLIPTRDGIDVLQPCVDAILERTEYRHFEVLILDNQSRCQKTLAYMQEVARRDSRVRVLNWDYPFNYSAINNYGAAHARGSILGLINNDIEPIDGGWLTEMVSHAWRPEIGCVGAKLLYPNDTIQHGGVILGLGGVAGHAHRFFQRHEDGYCGRLKLVQNLSAVTAACLLLRKDIFQQVGGFNETDLAIAYNDVDLCLKVREAGYRNLWTPYAELYHHESISRGPDDTPQKRSRALREVAYMRQTWGAMLDQDPAYNANLTLIHEDFSLR